MNAASYDSINYDSEGKVASTVTKRGALAFTVQRTYDDANRPDTVTVTGPWGSSTSAYLYDRFGRLEAVRDLAGRWTELFHNQKGLLDSLRLPITDTARSGFTWTPRHQLARVLSETPNQTRQYAYSPLGLMLRDSISSGTVGWQHQYGYDGMQRVQSWDLHKFGRKRVCVNIRDCTTVDTDSVAQSLSFAWDAVGNPAGATRETGNRVRAYGGYSFDYDADGNLTRKYNASGFNQTFTWNALGQLTGTTRTGAGSATYKYDGLGRRIQRQDHTGAVTHYVYDGDDLVLEVDGAGNRIREYTYFPGIDNPHSMRQWANGAGSAIYYYQMQRPGHVSGLVNTSNQLVNEYRYTPFGMPVNGYPVQGTPNPLQYMARELDALSGLYYVRSRWYDPQQGRFVSEDPIGLAGGINHYAYAGNSPANATDPTGLCTFTGRSADGRLIQMYIPDVMYGNAGGGPVQMFLNCSGVNWIMINEWNAMLVGNYNTAWGSMYGRSPSGPRGANDGGSSAPDSRAADMRCAAAWGLFSLQVIADGLFFTGAGTAASLALRGTISTTLGRGLASSTARVGLSNSLSMPVRSMAPEMIGNGLVMQSGALGAGTTAVSGWSLSPVGSAAEQALMAQGGGIGSLGLADFVPGWATWDAFQTAREVCRGG